MFLAIDVGNTHTTFGAFDASGDLRLNWRIQTNPKNTADELVFTLEGLLAMQNMKLESVKVLGLSCVVPALLRTWKVAASRISKPIFVVNELQKQPIAIDTPHPESAGADRIANLVAAMHTYGAPVMVVDFGTATNIDVADASGAFVGGVIAPGVLLSAEALFSKAALLRGVPLKTPKHAIGDTTENSIQSGVIIGTAAMIEGLIARIKGELNAPECPVIATGGLARTIGEATTCFDAVEPDLTLQGIFYLWQSSTH